MKFLVTVTYLVLKFLKEVRNVREASPPPSPPVVGKDFPNLFAVSR